MQSPTALGTPAWVYSATTMRRRTDELRPRLCGRRGSNAHIHYAVKANDLLAVLRVFVRTGAGADVVSGGELLRAREAGIPPGGIVFSGVGKTADELRLALTEDIAQINVESAEELDMLSALAAGMGRTARIALRINPDVDAGTHSKISTGRARDKFGIPYRRRDVALCPGSRHAGAAADRAGRAYWQPGASLAPYRRAFARLAELVRELRVAGHPVHAVDCGGGLGIGYRNEPAVGPTALAGALRVAFDGLEVELIVEPGRWLVGPAGVLLTSVLLVKKMSDIAFRGAGCRHERPRASGDVRCLARHRAGLAGGRGRRPVAPADIVGPVCESGDTFARNRPLPPLVPGARVAILDAGAYGAVMSSTYNARPLAAAAMVDSDRWSVIRARQAHAALWQDERVPEWLE